MSDKFSEYPEYEHEETDAEVLPSMQELLDIAYREGREDESKDWKDAILRATKDTEENAKKKQEEMCLLSFHDGYYKATKNLIKWLKEDLKIIHCEKCPFNYCFLEDGCEQTLEREFLKKVKMYEKE